MPDPRPAAATPLPDTVALRLLQAFVAIVLVLSLLLALVVPYHATDALVYGQLSQVIAREGTFLSDLVGYPAYSRPLFYAPQGALWWLFGGHDWIGRLLSLAFFALLLWALWRLASKRELPPLTGWLVLAIGLALPDLVVQAFAGQTDVPTAALIALAAVLAWRWPDRTRTAVLLTLVVAAAVLAKATALPALVGLGAACLVGDRAGLRARLTYQVLPIAAGTGLGLVYGWVMARHFGIALNSFLGGAVTVEAAPAPAAGAGGGPGAGTAVVPQTRDAPISERVSDALSDLVGSGRLEVLGRAEWLGPYLRLILLVSLVYAVARVVRAPHRAAVGVAVAVAVPWYLLAASAPLLDNPGAVLGSALALVVLAAAAWCPAALVPSRLLLGRLLLWALPPLLAWTVFGILGDTRTLSPAWPALLVLLSVMFAVGIAGLRERVRAGWAVVAAVAVVVALAALDLRNLDGLGARPDGTINSLRALSELTPATWADPDEARRAADPQLGGLVVDSRAARPPGGRVLTNDGRLGFYFGTSVDVAPPPQTCADARGYRVVTVLLNVPEPFDGQLPCLEPVSVQPGSYAVYRVTDG
ncbi:MAG TPA: hypothetical protein VIL49_12855 [Capillimicrobium sp.]|jgi:4-amino-4-deoxy-L-arabinose transferase-like glycosyltransferase